ncbi:phosphatidylglycerol lysyltransferase domain-containing protein [Microvirga makkahensis]|uniref:DUF2156 domain-containing protein n=1 Tax=Microvirga makkahensis TaxID=1128670 RepID=A0A7X3SPM3_9HYPH|nr:phosphatidylglycerol lysyltransferase domain-containing protein [Microvirga makkahensis]MXQ12274.1 DUF2156 domain-containing protein [Microvirga makkahensis]
MTGQLSLCRDASRSGPATQPFVRLSSLRLENTASRTADLADLASIEPEDADTFLAAAEHARVKSWFYYFPRLHCYGQSKAHMLRWERYAGSILVYQIRRRKTGSDVDSRMNLYLPPFPFDPAALRYALQRMRDFNGDRSGRIIRVQESDVISVAREGLKIALKEEEFIFDRAAVLALEGPIFKGLRQQLSCAIKSKLATTRPYTALDQPACRALVEAWRERLIASGTKATTSYNHTIACLAAADRFPPSLLTGLVGEVDGEVRGFAFSGPLTSTMGCNYLCITHTDFRGVPYLLRYRLMAGFPDLIYFNDSHDAGRPGLRHLKQRFRPVEMHAVFSAWGQ